MEDIGCILMRTWLTGYMVHNTWHIMDPYMLIIHFSITIYYNVVTGAGFLTKISAVSAYNSSKLVVDRT